MGAWAATVSDQLPKHWHDRYDLFREALRHVTGDAPLYLEFGVYQGDTLVDIVYSEPAGDRDTGILRQPADWNCCEDFAR